MRRIRELDTLRGIWSIMILWFHATEAPIFAGWSRVDFFFVLSGFLITRHLVNKENVSIKLFYLNRLLRLLPYYYVLLSLIFLADQCRFDSSHMGELFASITFVQSLHYYWNIRPMGYFPEYLAHTWTLEIEFFFCMTWPLLVRFVDRRLVFSILLWAIVNSVYSRTSGVHPWTFLARCDGLALGAVLGFLLSVPGSAASGPTRLCLSFILFVSSAFICYTLALSLTPKAFDQRLDAVGSLALLATNLFYTGFVGLIVCFAGHPALRYLRIGWLAWIGDLSYAVYLYSFAAIWLARNYIPSNINSSGLTGITSLAISLCGAMITRSILDRPVQMLRAVIGPGQVSGTLGDGTIKIREFKND